MVIAAAAVVVGVYFLGPEVAGVVAVLTLVVAVPLALRHRRAESSSQVDVTADAIEYRRGGEVRSTLDRRSASFEVVTFTDRLGLVPQLLLTDGTQHVRLVTGQWQASTLEDLAGHVTPGPSPTRATWQEVKAAHGPALAFWERHTTAIIAGTVAGIPVLVLVGTVLAVLVLDAG